ncbi:competence type IV pilus minor pilin ComGF [Streptococcus suis]|uniref:competence type IV pilus minor pilin ComGF n=1 Tax=Streptococcus suis TaxID=1307 RepID=UPI00042054BE|nr:competence type IV pilus minor pilin ComGF [Streptococcus suis]MBS0789375.1 prepilin-type N-terminal cleavage/methylation domain-containing protein [Streptococcus suis]
MLKSKIPAFTLLECLVVLVILSGSLLIFEGLSKLLVQEAHYQGQTVQKEWLVFSSQLRSEWDQAELVKVENGKVYVNKGEQALAFGKSWSDDFRKTNDRGQGYQPMLYQVDSAAISQENQLVRIDFSFKNGEERTFIYAFKDKS